ncbi:MAG: hypothetical protein ACRECT_06180 [Thermoplasmata archaeon]
MRILLRPRWPVLALLLLAPTIPELLTGSTPISELVLNPGGFAVAFAGIVGLYGTGALLIREFAVKFRKGWASILLLGAAYGIAEEGLAVHTFFEPAGLSPVGALGAYGHAFGVNWLWALGLTAFHAVYSIALPILLVQLWFPEAREARWLDRGSTTLVAVVYVFVVALFATVVGHGPSVPLLALFLAIEAVLVYVAFRVPPDLLAVRPGPPRVGRWGLGGAGALFFTAWTLVLALSGSRGRVPAVAAGALLVAMSLVALFVILRWVGRDGLDRSKLRFAVGMLGVLFGWDVVVEFSVPGILAVSVAIALLLYHLDRLLDARARRSVPLGVPGGHAP